MQNDKFAYTLKRMFEVSGMTKPQVVKQTASLYGEARPYLNATDVNRLLAGEGAGNGPAPRSCSRRPLSKQKRSPTRTRDRFRKSVVSKQAKEE
jgi:hypothetical protein